MIIMGLNSSAILTCDGHNGVVVNNSTSLTLSNMGVTNCSTFVEMYDSSVLRVDMCNFYKNGKTSNDTTISANKVGRIIISSSTFSNSIGTFRTCS